MGKSSSIGKLFRMVFGMSRSEIRRYLQVIESRDHFAFCQGLVERGLKYASFNRMVRCLRSLSLRDNADDLAGTLAQALVNTLSKGDKLSLLWEAYGLTKKTRLQAGYRFALELAEVSIDSLRVLLDELKDPRKSRAAALCTALCKTIITLLEFAKYGYLQAKPAIKTRESGLGKRSPWPVANPVRNNPDFCKRLEDLIATFRSEYRHMTDILSAQHRLDHVTYGFMTVQISMLDQELSRQLSGLPHLAVADNDSPFVSDLAQLFSAAN